MINVIHVSFSDLSGGAARAAYRIHRSLVDHAHSYGIQSRMRVIYKSSDDSTVVGNPPHPNNTILRRLRTSLIHRSYSRFETLNPVLHSIAWPSTGLGKELNQSTMDIINLYWLGNNTLSIEEIGFLQKKQEYCLAST